MGLAGDVTTSIVTILWRDNPIGTLTRNINEACEEEYVFRIDWDAWDRVKPDNEIPGIDMSLRKDQYVRDHVPTFITDYVPPKRGDTVALLQRLGLKEYDIWDVMVATGRNCSDQFRVVASSK